MTKRNCTTQKPSKQAKPIRRKLTTDEFIRRSKAVHGDKFTYEHTVYVNNKTNLVVTCAIHGIVDSRMDHHLTRHGCPKCNHENNPAMLSKEEFIENCRKKHGYKYDYSLVDYKGNKVGVNIICAEHGVFSQIPNTHLKGAGCARCYGNKKATREEFIEKAIAKHGDRYSYDLIQFAGATKKIDIVCKDHGIFRQLGALHIAGSGCPSCVFYNIYSRRGFQSLCSKNNNGQGILYVIECRKNDELFYKIGMTSLSVKSRFSGSKMPYDYKLIYQIIDNGDLIYDLERVVHRSLKSYMYKPELVFQGYTECFSTIEPIEKWLKELSSTKQMQLLA